MHLLRGFDCTTHIAHCSLFVAHSGIFIAISGLFIVIYGLLIAIYGLFMHLSRAFNCTTHAAGDPVRCGRWVLFEAWSVVRFGEERRDEVCVELLLDLLLGERKGALVGLVGERRNKLERVRVRVGVRARVGVEVRVRVMTGSRNRVRGRATLRTSVLVGSENLSGDAAYFGDDPSRTALKRRARSSWEPPGRS